MQKEKDSVQELALQLKQTQMEKGALRTGAQLACLHSPTQQCCAAHLEEECESLRQALECKNSSTQPGCVAPTRAKLTEEVPRPAAPKAADVSSGDSAQTVRSCKCLRQWHKLGALRRCCKLVTTVVLCSIALEHCKSSSCF